MQSPEKPDPQADDVYDGRPRQKACTKPFVRSTRWFFFPRGVEIASKVKPEDPCASKMSRAVLEV